MPVCQTRHQTHSRHGGTHEDYSLTGAQKSNSPGPCLAITYISTMRVSAWNRFIVRLNVR